VYENLKNKHVVIAGCGGIGNIISLGLATSGIGKITLIDDDEIEKSNLTRQYLFSLEDIGCKKVNVLKRELEKRVEYIKIQAINSRINKELLENISDIDLIVLSADSADCMPIVNSYCVNMAIPFINIGYIQDIVVWGPFYIPNETGCFFCQPLIKNDIDLSEDLKLIVDELNGRYQAPSIGAINMFASSFGLLDIIKFLGGFGEVQSKNNRIGLWTHDLHLEKQNSNINPECKICFKKGSYAS